MSEETAVAAGSLFWTKVADHFKEMPSMDLSEFLDIAQEAGLVQEVQYDGKVPPAGTTAEELEEVEEGDLVMVETEIAQQLRGLTLQ